MFTEPRTWRAGERLTPTLLNEQVRDNLDTAGTVQEYTPELLAVARVGTAETQAKFTHDSTGFSKGYYVQVGNLVYFTASFRCSNGAAGSGTLTGTTGAWLVTTPTDVGLLQQGSVRWHSYYAYMGTLFEAYNAKAAYEGFTGRNGLWVGFWHNGSAADNYLYSFNDSMYANPSANLIYNYRTLAISGSYLIDAENLVGGLGAHDQLTAI